MRVNNTHTMPDTPAPEQNKDIATFVKDHAKVISLVVVGGLLLVTVLTVVLPGSSGGALQGRIALNPDVTSEDLKNTPLKEEVTAPVKASDIVVTNPVTTTTPETETAAVADFEETPATATEVDVLAETELTPFVASTEAPPPVLSSPFDASYSAEAEAAAAAENTSTDAPPSLTPAPMEPVSSIEPQVEETQIEILEDYSFPVGFNPNLAKTKITFSLSEPAAIDLKITDTTGYKIVTLVNDETFADGEYDTEWNGTNKVGTGGTIVDPGTYYYEITAKNLDDGSVEDTARGNINVVYSKTTADFEDAEAETSAPPSLTPSASSTETGQQSANAQAQAVMAMQNTTSGVTSDTGPEVMIYLLPVLASFLFPLLKKQQS